jgi:CRISPR/Cas system-associated exonuclease Cas4 (RecB family)
MQKIKLDPYLTCSTKLTYMDQWFKLKSKSYETLRKKIGENLHGVRAGTVSYIMTPKAYIIKDKNKFYFNKEQSTE